MGLRAISLRKASEANIAVKTCMVLKEKKTHMDLDFIPKQEFYRRVHDEVYVYFHTKCCFISKEQTRKTLAKFPFFRISVSSGDFGC